MSAEPSVSPEAELGFARDDDVPTAYMKRTRDYYLALGYANPYRWAQFSEVPFAEPPKPLRESRIGLITTAAPHQAGVGDQGPGAKYNAQAKFYRVYTGPTDAEPDLRISHVGYDRAHTSAEDINTYFPLARLREAVEARRVGSLASRFYGAPTNRSQRVTMEVDAPEILARAREDGVDAALVVAN